MENRCVICGEIIPEGKQYCSNCEEKYGRKNKDDIKKRCVICGVPLPLDMDICKPCEKKIKNSFYYTNAENPTVAIIKDTKSQSAKADEGKPVLSLVPTEIIYEIEKVRSYGVKKYKNSDNWKNVELERYHEALLRHTLAVWDDIGARDEESGLLHLSHIATNIAFILEMLKDKE